MAMDKDEFMKRVVEDLDIGDVVEMEMPATMSPKPVATKTRRKKYDSAQLRELYDAGRTDAEIMAETGIGKSTLARWRQENGLQPNKCKRADAPTNWRQHRVERMERAQKAAEEIPMHEALLEETQDDLARLARMTLRVLSVMWDVLKSRGALPPVE